MFIKAFKNPAASVKRPLKAEFGKSESGLHFLTFAIFGSLFVAALYSVFQILPFFYDYWELENQFQSVIRVASMEKDSEIRRRLMGHIKYLGIPCDPQDLKIERDDKKMKISLSYQEIFSVPWRGKEYDLHTFDFDIYVEGEM